MTRVTYDQIKSKEGIRRATNLRGSRYKQLTEVNETSESEFAKTNLGIRILLHGLYIGHHFDGWFRGNTGEFYWYSVVSDGNDLYVQDSRNIGFGKNGILTGVESKSWINFDLLELFRSTKPPKRGYAHFSFTLMEDDNSDEAKAIFRAGASAAGKAASLFFGSSLAGAEEGVKNFFERLVDIDESDHAIQAIRGLDRLNNYRLGEFIRLEGKTHDGRPTFAVCSIIPEEELNLQKFFFEQKIGENITFSGKTYKVDIPQEGLLSLFIRVRSGRTGVILSGPDGQQLNGGWTIIRNFKVKPGPFTFNLKSFLHTHRVDLRYMFTAVNEKLDFSMHARK